MKECLMDTLDSRLLMNLGGQQLDANCWHQDFVVDAGSYKGVAH